jgi:hypothetical protein
MGLVSARGQISFGGKGAKKSNDFLSQRHIIFLGGSQNVPKYLCVRQIKKLTMELKIMTWK